jgi:IS5 family transposase
MSSKRFHTDPSFADALIPQSPRKTFYDRVDEVIDWCPIEALLKARLGKEVGSVGPTPFPPLPLFKAVLFARWNQLSERALEEAWYHDLRLIRFSGLSITSDKPDHSTLNRFRNALAKDGLYEELLALLNGQLEAAGLLVKTGVIVDATLVESSRRPRKSIEVAPKPEGYGEVQHGPDSVVRYSDDPDATWTIKAGKPVYGYKANALVDAKEGFLLGGHVTSAHESDMKQLERSVQGLESGTFVLADKGYASAENRGTLKSLGLLDGIMKKAVRGRPLSEQEKSLNRSISKLRYRVERCFGCLKLHLGFDRTRYLGKEKVELEFYLDGFAFNVKGAVGLVS